jgi:choice-of-anchor A domain-containing protein
VAFVLGLGLALGFTFQPSPALALSVQENQFYKDCKFVFDEAGKVGGFVSGVSSAISFSQKVLTYLGFLDAPLSLDDIKAEMLLIASYQNWTTQQNSINEAYRQATLASNILTNHADHVSDGTFHQVYPYDQPGVGDDLNNYSAGAVAQILSQGSGGSFRECSRLPLFQRFGSSSSNLTVYDWRVGMAPALSVVALRLLAIAVMDPTFKTDGTFDSELNDIRSCLQEHLNLIHPIKPAAFCKPSAIFNQGGFSCSSLHCSESRSWVGWEVPQSDPSFPLCMQYMGNTSAPPEPAWIQFEDLETITGSNIDSNNLPPVLALQRAISTIAQLISKQPDLAEKNHTIPFGANPGLCLSLKAGSTSTLALDNCSSGSPYLNWTYDRVLHSLRNVQTGTCVQIPGPLTAASPKSSPFMITCADPNVDGVVPNQEFDWNPELGLIVSPFGPVLAVTDPVPQAGSLVSAVPSNSWHLNQQTWTNAVASTCTGAICPATGMGAWTQSDWRGIAIPPNQRYPEDFSIFSYLGASGMYDVQGPVAVNGTFTGAEGNWYYMDPGTVYGGINMKGFALNTGISHSDFQGMPVGLVAGAGANVLLSNGTVNGMLYVGSYVDPAAGVILNKDVPSSVTMYPKANNPVHTNPINFEMAFVKLQGLSTTLSGYPITGTVTPPPSNYGVMKLTSANPTLAVFSVTDSDLRKSGTIQFQVPSTSTILINVSGTEISIGNTGFSGTTRGPSSILWNFYQATNAQIGNVALPGSVLAPLARMHLSWGSVDGTLAAWDVDATSEFHWFPFQNNALLAGP